MTDFLRQNILMILTVLMFVIGIVRGYKKGLVKILLSFSTAVLALLGAAYATPRISEMLWQREEVDRFFTTWSGKILDAVEEFLGGSGLPLFDVLNLDRVAPEAAMQLARFLVQQIIFLVCFVAFLLLLRWLASLVGDGVNYLPFIGTANRMAGALGGLLEMLIYVWLVMAALSLFSQEEWCIRILDSIRSNRLLSFIYNNNLVLRFLASLVS